jgi:surface antigen
MRQGHKCAAVLAAVSLLPASASFAAPSPEPQVAAAAKKLRYLRFFPKGQCTRYAYRKRPEIANRAIGTFRLLQWDGRHWAANARRAGFPVGGTPRKGDIAVWGRNEYGAFATGHVGYVKHVFTNGSFRVSEVNWKGSRRAGQRTVPRSVARKLQFIHKR